MRIFLLNLNCPTLEIKMSDNESKINLIFMLYLMTKNRCCMKNKITEWFEDLKWYFTNENSELSVIIFLLLIFFPFLAGISSINAKIILYSYLLITIFYYCFLLYHYLKNIELKENLKNFFKLLKYLVPFLLALIIQIGLPLVYLFLLHQTSYPAKYQSQQAYVYAFPNKEYSKNYRLKADMDYDSESGYQVSKIYFDNGGYIEFNFCEDGYKKGDLFFCEADNDEQEWHFRYYGEKVLNE